MVSRLFLRRILMVGALGLILSFQNCSTPLEDTSQSSISAFKSSLPFAYREQLDTISYMSCSEIKNAVERRAYFTLRAGAYSNISGGVALSKAFLDSTKHYSAADRARVLSESPANSDARLSLTLRQSRDLQAPWTSDELRVGEEIESFLPALDTQEIGGPLAAAKIQTDGNAVWMNYFPGPHAKRLVEASLRFLQFENVASQTRTILDNRDALLVAGYSTLDDELDINLRAPEVGSKTSVYGSGYQLRFSLPKNYSAGERRVLSPNGGVTEVDLLSGKNKTATWNCSTAYQFMVVRPEDVTAGKVICNATVDRYTNTTQQAALAAIRRVLRVEDWYVDTANGCVMPKLTGDYCYGDLKGRTVQYGGGSCSNSATTSCPHIVSVCIRQ